MFPDRAAGVGSHGVPHRIRDFGNSKIIGGYSMQMRRSRFMTGLYLQTALVVAVAPIWCSSLTSLSFAKPATNAITATYVTTAEIDAALQQMPPTSTTYDKPIKTVDTGTYKVTIVVLRRIPGKTADSALLHDRVTEVYQILTGAGMFET
jgi:hypothetical protein